jgi:hypothetical protein
MSELFNLSDAQELADSLISELSPYCEKISVAILKEFQVLEIREKGKTGQFTNMELGIQYGVHKDTIRDILKNKSWKHLL